MEKKIGSFDGWMKIINHKITMRGVTAAHSISKYKVDDKR